MSSSRKKHIFYNEYLPDGWEICTVDSIKAPEKYSCTAGPFGSNISSKYFVEEGVPVIRGGNLTIGKEQFIAEDFVFVSEDKAKSFPGQHVKAGDLVFTCWGTLGQVGLIPDCGPYDEYIISNKQLKLRPDAKKCNAKFLYHYFALPQMVRHINDIAIGSAVPGINLGLLKGIKVVLPPKDQQDKIAAILSAYDDLIENNKRRIAVLEKMAEEIYREWFVRFRFPGYQQAEFEKGIPKEWEATHIDKLLERLTVGKRYEQKTVESLGLVPVLDQGQSGIIGYHNDKPGVFATTDKPVIVFANHTCYQRMIFFPFSTIQNVLPFKPSEKYPSSIYWLHYATKDVISFSEYKGHWPEFVSKQVLYPGEEVTLEFEEVIKPLLKQVENLSNINGSLTRAKNLLLPRLISGKLSVEELDIQFPPSMQEEVAA